MSNTYCSVFECRNVGSATKINKPNVKYYSFSTKPHQQDRMKVWINFVKRKSINGQDWKPTKNSRICSEHFIGNAKCEHPQSPSYNPSIRSLTNTESESISVKNKVDRYHRFRTRNPFVTFEECDMEQDNDNYPSQTRTTTKENRNNMLPTVSLVRLPGMTENKSNDDKNRRDENVRQLFCANCGLHDDSLVHIMVVDLKKQQQQVSSNFGQPNYEKKRVVMDVHTALSSIYKLDCLKKFPPDQDDILKNNEDPMVICKSCSTVLIPLYKLLQEFNVLRSMDSILQQKILKLDSRLDKILQNEIKEEPDSDEEFTSEIEETSEMKQEVDDDSMESPLSNYRAVEDNPQFPHSILALETEMNTTSKKNNVEDPPDLHNPEEEELTLEPGSSISLQSPPKSLLSFKPSIIDELPEFGNNFTCSLCPSTFHTKIDLSDHIYTEHVEKNKTLPSTSCPLCPKKYPSDPSKLKAHILFTHAEAGAGSLECPTCHKKFYRSCNLARHIQGHVAQSSRVELRCDVCGQKMGNQTILNIHMKRHAGDFQFPCPFPGCTKSYVTATELKKHEQSKHPVDKNAFICETCGKGFPVQTALNLHMKNVHHKDNLFPCPSCPRRFRSQGGLDKHVKEDCKKEPPKFICDECGKIYKSDNSLQIHLRFHKGDALICPRPDCGKKFYDKHTLKVHLRVHDEGKPFKCPNCDHASASSTNLNQHVQSKHPELVEDAEDKSQLCPICGIKILGDYRLKKHLRVVHSEKIHECESCGKKFKTVPALQEHLKIHGGEKTHHCEWPGCNKSFYGDRRLKKHIQTHTREKNFECPECGKKFAGSSNLKQHSRSHSEGTFNCSVCERVFKQPQSLKTHMATHEK